MTPRDWLKLPLWLAGLAGTGKSFLKNPVIGDPGLNVRGLHRSRVGLANRLAGWRRSVIAGAVRSDHRAAFDRDGYVAIPDCLPPEVFAGLVERLGTTPLPAREMRQGQTVTRMIPLGPSVLALLPEARRVVDDREIAGLIRYAASTGGPPVWYVQTVIAKPDRRRADPQTELHADTFHPTAKAWLFLQDVGEDDGPFMYVPGSHRLTPARLEWEYRTSLTARDDPRIHHAHGSFRVRPPELEAMGLPPPMKMTVKANTLVVADTFGFHARTPSRRPTLRMELHGYLRLNPFMPLPWPGPRALPGIGSRQLDIYLAYLDFTARMGRTHPWTPVGSLLADAPPRV